jgi:hypothetical protein
MGWWRAGKDGSSLHAEDTGLVWGDGPADILDDAIEAIVAEFTGAYGRKPTQEELKAGLLFSLSIYDENMERLPDDFRLVPEPQEPGSPWQRFRIVPGPGSGEAP